jgi:hypothetical protein
MAREGATVNGYPVKWKEETLLMGELTKAVKDAFVKWVKPRVLKEASETLKPNEYVAFRQEVMAGGVFWSAVPSMAVAVAMAQEEGSIYLNRLLFGKQVEHWTDAELWEMLQAKDEDEKSDYRIAFDLIWENSDPKAKRLSNTLEGQTPPENSCPS